MPSAARITSSEFDQLAGNPEAKDALVCERMGLRADELKRVRATDPFSALHHAAELIGRDGRPEDITHISLGAILFSEWNSPRGRATAVHSKIQEYFGTAVESRFTEWGLKVPAIQCLREAVLGYHGNLYEAAQAWPGIQISDTDLAKNLRIPLFIGREEAYTLGVIWADGFISHESGRYSMRLTGGAKDTIFYQEAIAPRINSQFNVRIESCEVKPGWGPYMFLNSQAITSWLLDHLGFPHPKEDVHLPRLEWNHQQREGFLNGIFDSMGSLHAYRPGTSFCLSINDADKPFVQNIEAVSRIEGLCPKEQFDLKNGSHKLTYRTPEVRQAYRRGLLTHPTWTEALSILKR